MFFGFATPGKSRTRWGDPGAICCDGRARRGSSESSRKEDTAVSKKPHTPNDQRSIVKNPNNAAYATDRGNRIDQGHPNVPPPPPSSPKPESK